MKKTYAVLALAVACVAATACTNPVQSPSGGEAAPNGSAPESARYDGGLVLGSGSRSDPVEGNEPATATISSAGTEPGGPLVDDGRGGLVLGSGSFTLRSGLD